MNSINVTSIILFLAIILLTVFIGGKEINSKIEETIQNNYQTEIQSLRDKINQQSELINSIIDLNKKDDDDTDNEENGSDQNGVTNDDTPTNKPNEDQSGDKEAQSDFVFNVEGGEVIITKYVGKQTSVTIPNTINGLPVVKIAENAFADTKVKSVSLPSSCTKIDWFAFYGCYALTSVYIPSSVETIGYGAFDGCSKKLTVYCEEDSFAEKYAQSFGISYSEYK